MSDIKEVLSKYKSIAMVGVSNDRSKASTIVMKYMQKYGFKVFPVNPKAKGQKIYHYLFVDDHFTWWELGKSYLCRIFDMMHTGHVDRVYFGKQVVTEFPNDLKEHLDA